MSTSTLVHDRRGAGEPLVLVHGTGSRWQVWGPVLPLLVPHREVISIDLPGFGASEADGTEPTLEEFTTRVERFFVEAGIERPHVGGNSLGGAIALELVRRGRARSATAFSPAGFWTPKEVAWAQKRLLSGLRGAERLRPLTPVLAHSALFRCLSGWYLFGRPWSLPAHEVIAAAEAAIGAASYRPTVEAFPRLGFHGPEDFADAQVLIAWGERDGLLPVRQAARAERLLPDARHVRMPGCGHVPFYDDPALCAALLLEGSAPAQ